jgi:hypothetical protein
LATEEGVAMEFLVEVSVRAPGAIGDGEAAERLLSCLEESVAGAAIGHNMATGEITARFHVEAPDAAAAAGAGVLAFTECWKRASGPGCLLVHVRIEPDDFARTEEAAAAALA